MSVDIEDGDIEEVTPPPAAPQIDVGELARQLAREVGATRPNTTAVRESKLEKTIEGMLAKGIQKEAISHLLELVEAREADRDIQRRQENAVEDFTRLNNEMFALAEDSVSALTNKIAGGKKLTPGLVRDVSDLIKDNAEFKDLKEKLGSGRKLSRSEIDRVSEKAFNDYCAEAGVTKRQPMDVRSSKPKAGSSNAFSEDELDRDQKKLYLAVKNTLGAEKAQAYIKQFR